QGICDSLIGSYKTPTGLALGWLIDRKQRAVYIYRPNQAPELLNNPDEVSGDPELPGFRLSMAKIW
ncbi:MAG: Uma2 family endonuclease, partial [Thainema sp.]